MTRRSIAVSNFNDSMTLWKAFSLNTLPWWPQGTHLGHFILLAAHDLSSAQPQATCLCSSSVAIQLCPVLDKSILVAVKRWRLGARGQCDARGEMFRWLYKGHLHWPWGLSIPTTLNTIKTLRTPEVKVSSDRGKVLPQQTWLYAAAHQAAQLMSQPQLQSPTHCLAGGPAALLQPPCLHKHPWGEQGSSTAGQLQNGLRNLLSPGLLHLHIQAFP